MYVERESEEDGLHRKDLRFGSLYVRRDLIELLRDHGTAGSRVHAVLGQESAECRSVTSHSVDRDLFEVFCERRSLMRQTLRQTGRELFIEFLVAHGLKQRGCGG
jgi:hypothetical protein